MGFFKWLLRPPTKEQYDTLIAKLKIKKKDWEDIVSERKGKISEKVWNIIQRWSAEEIQQCIFEMKHGEVKEQIPELLLEHLYIANEILRYKERAVETQREIERTIRNRDKNHGTELKAA